MITFDSDFMEILIEHDITMTIEVRYDDMHFIFQGEDQFNNKWQVSELITKKQLMMFKVHDANVILGDRVDRLVEEIQDRSGGH